MANPEKCYRDLVCNYIQNSVKNNTNLMIKYSDLYLSNQSTDNLENIVRNINKDHPLYNAMMAGAIFQSYCDEVGNDECTAICCYLENYFNLFGIDLKTDSYK